MLEMLIPAPDTQFKYVQGIPVEIWSKIFEHSLPSFDCLCKNIYEAIPRNSSSRSIDNAPLSVSQTCSMWRDIAINLTPSIWSSLLVRIDSQTMVPGPREIDEWVLRSRHRPLSVYIEGRFFDGHITEDTYRLLSRFFKHTPRWKFAALSFSGITEEMASYLESVFKYSDTPLLEYLVSDLGLAQPNRELWEILPSDLWKMCPQLRNLKIVLVDSNYGSRVSRWTTSSGIPYEQLTSLSLEGVLHDVPIIDVVEVIYIFKYAQNLVSCSIEGIAGPDLDDMHLDVAMAPVLSKHLEFLRLSMYLEEEAFTDDHYAGSRLNLLCFLTTPSLASLILGWGFSWSHPHYSAFIYRSGCKLQELFIESMPTFFQDFEGCMKLSPSLKRLHVDNDHPKQIGEFVAQMSKWDPFSQQFALCPNLEEISLQLIDNFDWGQVQELLRIRLCPPSDTSATFSTFGISAFDMFYSPLDPQLSSLQHLHMKLYVCNTVYQDRWAGMKRVYINAASTS